MGIVLAIVFIVAALFAVAFCAYVVSLVHWLLFDDDKPPID